jgi:dolichol-phosphate mannosyltransferase
MLKKQTKEIITQSVSIILPTYNEVDNVCILIPRLEALFQKLDHFVLMEIIVFDDFSPDGTAHACKKMNEEYHNIMVLQKQKEGIGAALHLGYTSAKGDIILSMDADLSFLPEDVPSLLHKISDGYDLVLGSRHILHGGYEKQLLATKIKWFLSSCGNKIITTLFHIPVHDFSGNFRAIPGSVWKDICVQEKTNLMLFETVLQVQKKGYRIAEVPVVFYERRFGKSKLHLFLESLCFLKHLLRHKY